MGEDPRSGPRTVLVTGANGFVGRSVAAALVATGNRVRGAVRTTQATASLPEAVEPRVVTDMGDADAWHDAVADVDAVVHLVGLAHQDVSGEDAVSAYRSVNVGITAALATACAARGTRRLVYLSSIKAVGEGATSPYTEDTPCQPEDAYGTSKREAERLLLEEPYPFEAVVVRPPMVYGPEVKGNFLRLLRALERGVPLPLGRVRALRSMVFVGNLADAVIALVDAPGAAGEAFHVADAEPWCLPLLLDRLGRLLGRPATLVPVPVPVLELAGALLGRRDDVRRLTGPLVVSTAKLRDSVGWEPPFSNDAGLEATASWFSSRMGRSRGDR